MFSVSQGRSVKLIVRSMSNLSVSQVSMTPDELGTLSTWTKEAYFASHPDVGMIPEEGLIDVRFAKNAADLEANAPDSPLELRALLKIGIEQWSAVTYSLLGAGRDPTTSVCRWCRAPPDKPHESVCALAVMDRGMAVVTRGEIAGSSAPPRMDERVETLQDAVALFNGLDRAIAALESPRYVDAKDASDELAFRNQSDSLYRARRGAFKLLIDAARAASPTRGSGPAD